MTLRAVERLLLILKMPRETIWDVGHHYRNSAFAFLLAVRLERKRDICDFFVLHFIGHLTPCDCRGGVLAESGPVRLRIEVGMAGVLDALDCLILWGWSCSLYAVEFKERVVQESTESFGAASCVNGGIEC